MEIDPQLHAQNIALPPDVKMNSLLLHSIFDLKRIVVKDDHYIVKVFPQNLTALYNREKAALEILNHPNILKPIPPNIQLVGRLSNFLKTNILVFPQAMRGNLLDYIDTKGALSQKAAKFYISQLIDALIYCQQQANITHPSLSLDNMLINQDRNLILCGWSNSCQNLHSSSASSINFRIAELIINLVTSRNLFICKDSKSDAYAKFLSQKYIHKLWEQLQKVIKKIIKNFNFTESLKSLVSQLLLKKVTKIHDIKTFNWFSDIPTLEQVTVDMQAQQKKAEQLRKQRSQKEKKNQQKEQLMVKEMVAQIQPSLSRTNSRYDDQFIQQYLQCQNYKWELHEKSPSDHSIYFPLFENDLKVILAHLSIRLSEAQDHKEDIIDPLLVLKEYKLNFDKDKIKFECVFGWDLDLVEADLMGGIHFQGEIAVRREGSRVIGRVEVLQVQDLNKSCVRRLVKWFEDILTEYA